MKKTLTINYKAWVGDTIYYSKLSSIEESIICKVEHSSSFYLTQDSYHNRVDRVKTQYILQNGNTINDDDIGVKYFTDKKELIQHLVSQL